MRRGAASRISTMLLSLTLVGCGRNASLPGDGQAVDVEAAIQLNWKPEPQFGGFYAADMIGAFTKRGIQASVVAGGVGTPTVQMIGAGKVDFGVVSADELIIARTKGNYVVALFAVYQDSPGGIMTRASRGFKDIGDIFRSPGTVAMERGLPYAKMLEKRYGFEKVRIVPSPGGDLSLFLNDATYSQQCFVTSEPIAARRAGIEPKTFLVAESGYNPYTTVLATSDEYLKKNPKTVQAVVAAVREGWQAYLNDPSSTNAKMHSLNPGMDLDTFAQAAAAQKPLIENADTKAGGLGSMTRERWQRLAGQLVELGAIKQAPEVDACFVNP